MQRRKKVRPLCSTSALLLALIIVLKLSLTVRKAYKKRALQTHPDRLPQGATAADKAESDEKFRRVRRFIIFVIYVPVLTSL